MNLAEFFVALSFKGDKGMISSLDTLRQKSIAFADKVSTIVNALNAMTQAARDQAYALDLYEKTTGKSSERLQELSYQAAQFNITQDQLAATLTKIQQISTDVRLGRGMPSAFTLLGIDPNQDPEQILAKVQQAISHLDSPTALNIANELGIDEKMFYMLKMTAKGMESLNKQYRITAEERTNLVKLNAEWGKFWFLLKQITSKFQASTAQFQAEVIKRFLEIANRVADLVSAFIKATEASAALRAGVIALGVVLTAVFAPWLLILGAVFLVLEDIYTYFEGGDSITGRVVEWVKQNDTLLTRLEVIRDIYIALKETIKEIVGYIKEAYDFWQNMFKGSGSNILNNIGNAARNALSPVGGIGVSGLDFLGKLSHIGTQNNNIINNIYSNGDAQEVGEEATRQMSDSLYQLSEVQG